LPFLKRADFFPKNYIAVQRVHDGEISRLGGFGIYISLWVYVMCFQNNQATSFLEILLVSTLPMIFISIKEDLFQNTYTLTRILFMVISTLLFFELYDISFPIINNLVFGDLLSSSVVMSTLFFVICMLVIINGSNMIDGTNGLLSMTLMMQFLCLIYISFEYNDSINIFLITLLTIPLIVFMFFNYPWGKIFLGDTGAYFMGFTIGVLTIVIFSEHPEIPTWLAVLILFYPSFELIFSIIRKLIEGKNPMKPDVNHLHLKMFFLLRNNLISVRSSNSMVMPFLAIIWGFSFVLLVCFINNIYFIFLGLVSMTIFYLGLYFALPRNNN